MITHSEFHQTLGSKGPGMPANPEGPLLPILVIIFVYVKYIIVGRAFFADTILLVVSLGKSVYFLFGLKIK